MSDAKTLTPNHSPDAHRSSTAEHPADSKTSSGARKGRPSEGNGQSLNWAFYLPYLVLAALHIPLITVYFLRDLSARSHYHFYPFLLAGVAFLIWERWPRETERPLRQSWLSTVLFALSGMVLAFGMLCLEPPIASLSLALGMSSFLLRIKDLKTGGSLFPVSLLMYVIVHSPFRQLNEDMHLISWLQAVSARITSVLLDLVGVLHDMPGTVLVTAERRWGVEEACSGVQSFFTLLFISLFWVLWLRRPWFRGTLLVLSSVFWAIVMNTVRIFVIPVAFLRMGGLDLSEGWQHAALGYFTLSVGILFVLSTDQFFDFLFGAIDSEKSGSDAEVSQVSRFWNRFIAGESSAESRSWSPSFGWKIVAWSFTGIAALVALIVSPGLMNLDGLDFFRKDVVIRADRDWLPQEIDGWQMVDFAHSTRARGNDLGQRSDVWTYTKDGVAVIFSFDQAFPGWHELTTCYQRSETGWQIASGDNGLGRRRMVIDAQVMTDAVSKDGVSSDGAASDGAAVVANEVSLVSVDLVEPTAGMRGHLMFGLDDISGEPLDAPGDWSFLTRVFEQIKNRLAYEVRSNVLRGEAYQTQVFVRRQLEPEGQKILGDLYVKLRSRIQDKIRAAKDAGNFMSEEELESERLKEEAEARKQKEQKDKEKESEKNSAKGSLARAS